MHENTLKSAELPLKNRLLHKEVIFVDKICPFLLMTNPSNVAGMANCRGEDCALWKRAGEGNEVGCALRSIVSMALPK